MKQRFSSLDVKAIAQELSQALCTLRLANIYDLSSRIFLFKFAKPDNRQSLVVESGFRCHLTNFTRVTATAPSAFVVRLRKFLRTRRVTAVNQVGTDRIIELQFSDGQYRLFLEFYAGGNVILTDRDLGVITLLRIVDEEKEQLRVGVKYSLDNRQNYHGVPELSLERIEAGLKKALEHSDREFSALQKKSKRKSGDALRKALTACLNEFPPTLIDHALLIGSFDSERSVEDVLKDHALLENLMIALRQAQAVVDGIYVSETCKGYIFAKSARKTLPLVSSESQEERRDVHQNLMYEDFHPFRPRQLEGNQEIQVLEFDGFNKAVDEFFSSIESQKLESRLTEREEHAVKKIENARQDHEKRLDNLQQTQELNVRKAQAIEANLQKVQEAIVAVNGLLAQGMDWMDVARLIEMEQGRQNIVAEMIRLPLKLYENSITLLLAEAVLDEEGDYEGEETGSDVSQDSDVEQPISSKAPKVQKNPETRLSVDVDLALSPWANARQYYDQKKTAAVKEQKTIQSSEKALKNTEKKINADLKKGLKQEKEIMRPLRTALWFEKFVYFISSEGYLVLGGKDAQQNEILYQRHLRKGDVYVHADLNGAASVIVKNRIGMINSPIPPSTLSQAGTLTVATSTAWDSKAVMSAWWVDAEMVSKTTATGDYAPTGVFTIQGQKNYLPPAQLLLGFGIMFKISDESKARHLKHRVQEGPSLRTNITDEEPRGENNQNQSNDKVSEIESDGGDLEKKVQIDDDHDDHDDALPANTSKIVKSESGSDDDSEDGSDPEARYDNPLQPPSKNQSLLGPGKLEPGAADLESTPDLDSDHTLRTTSESSHDNTQDGDGVGDQDQEGRVSPPLDNRKRHLSAKERRILRNGTLGPINEPSETPLDAINSEEETQPSAPNTSNQPTKLAGNSKPQQPHVRGKHGKRNKIKSRYGDQDEEDRALAMRLLGSASAQEKTTEIAEAKASKEEEQTAQKERRRKQHALAVEKGKEAEAARKLKFETGNDTSNETEDHCDLDAFVGIPLPGDEILDALVMCGPWDAIGARCRWRAKLQPGSVKKGKAVREILGKWVSIVTDLEKKKKPYDAEGDDARREEQKVRAREGELVRALREPEVIGVVPVGKVRVTVGPKEPGGKSKGGGGGIGKGKRGGKGSKRQR